MLMCLFVELLNCYNSWIARQPDSADVGANPDLSGHPYEWRRENTGTHEKDGYDAYADPNAGDHAHPARYGWHFA